ncbi:hypothetical protein DFH07DRAFT_781223 [Mycena maculata]|uniref:Uncharacterized protein n=1 Tax=Mycena maculata TaxID=230809 RepID=A0AAD7I002_9AGAR|nr:hypothetical protein DFH07DRAFT_781223 [Mycena maculata]
MFNCRTKVMESGKPNPYTEATEVTFAKVMVTIQIADLVTLTRSKDSQEGFYATGVVEYDPTTNKILTENNKKNKQVPNAKKGWIHWLSIQNLSVFIQELYIT